MDFDESQVKRTMMGIVRAEIANIDMWLRRGARQVDIYDQFISQGMVGSFKGFNTAIQRARNQRHKLGTSPSARGLPLTVEEMISAVERVPFARQPKDVSDLSPSSTCGSDEKIDVEQFFRRKSIFDS